MELEFDFQRAFENHLRDVKWSQYAVDFCGLLFKASQDILESEGNSNGMSNEEADKVLKELKDITDSTGDSSVNPLAEALLGRFRFDDSAKGRSKKANAKEVLATLLKIDDHERAKYADAKDFLQHMIFNMKSLVNANNFRMCHIFNKFDSLDRYLYTLTEQRNFEAKSILNMIVNRDNDLHEFTEEQQKKIGALMFGAIGPVLTYLKSHYSDSKSEMPNTLEYSSALQFLYDEFGKFPAGSATLHQEFEKVNMMETVEMLNSMTPIDSSSYYPYDTDDDESDVEINDLSGLPESHMEWWSKYLQLK